jgi:uracil-DNA glycosylase
MDRDQLKEHLTFAAELGVAGVSRDPAWRTRTAPTAASAPSASSASRVRPGSDPGLTLDVQNLSTEAPLTFSKNAAEALAAIRADIGDCTRCKLHTLGRRQIVFGVGSPNADLMFVGEAPGADEDEQGIPFIGRAGQLLTKIIEAIDLRRDDVYIANIIKCRPPQNRNPEPDEVASCEPFLFGQFEYRGAKLIPTFHPAYLLRNPSSKREVWEDMKLVKRLLNSEA